LVDASKKERGFSSIKEKKVSVITLQKEERINIEL
jgi:hypothetical protein